MKRMFLLGCGLVWLVLAETISEAGVVALWEFDEGSGLSANSSVGGWTGTLVNFGTPPPVNPTPPEPGWITGSWNGLRFNKATGQTNAARVETTLPIFQQLTGKSFTLEYIGSLDTISNWAPFFGQSGGCCFFFGKTHPSTTPYFSMHYNLDGLGSTYSNGINNIQDGRMHHIALVFDDNANTMQFYVDYQPAGLISGVTGTLNSTRTDYLWFGSVAHQPANEFWNGYVDAVRISDEVLGPTQLYRYQAPPTPSPGVVAWYRFEDASGGNALDSSGNGFHAGLRNFESTAAGGGNTSESGWANALRSPLTDAGTPIPNTGSVRLDGLTGMNTGDFVQTPVPIPTGAFTVEAIVLAENPTAGWGPVFGESIASGNQGIFYFGKRSGSGAMHYNLWMNSPDREQKADLWNVNLADGQPHHIALMYDPNRKNIVVFFDYRAVHTINNVTGVLAPFAGSTFRLGARDDTHAGEKFDGRIDEARFWNIPILPYQMVGGPYQTGLPLRAYYFEDSFDTEKPDWNFLQNQTSQAAPRHVMIIDEPGNPGNKVLQISSTATNLAASAILQQRAEINRFEAQFRFRVPQGTGADGFTFGVFDVPYHLGAGGGYLGYYDSTGTLAGLYPSFAVEFDMYQGGAPGETNENHVAVQRNYNINDYVGAGPSTYEPSFDMEDGNWAYVRIRFDNGLISVWMNQTGFDFGAGDLLINQLDVGDVDRNGNGRFDPFLGYFGFTAGNGSAYNQILIDNFALTVVPEPSSLALGLIGLGGLLAALARSARRRGG